MKNKCKKCGKNSGKWILCETCEKNQTKQIIPKEDKN